MFSRNERSAIAYRVVQGIALIASFRLITIEYGPDAYGYVSLLMTFAAYLIFFDFGVISFMRTEISHSYSKYGEQRANSVALEGLKGIFFYAGSSYIFLLVGIFFFNQPQQLLHQLIQLDDLISIEIIKNSLLALVIYAGVMVIGNLILATLSAKGIQYRYFRVMILGSLLQFITILYAVKQNSEIDTLFTFLLLSGITPLAWFITMQIRSIFKNKGGDVNLKSVNPITNTFFIIQLGGLVVNNVDVLIVAYFYNMSDVAVYSTMKLIIQLPLSLHSGYIMQMWPILSAHRAKGEIEKVRLVFKERLVKTLYYSVLVAVSYIIVVAPAMEIWSDGKLTVNLTTVVLFSILFILYTSSSCYTIYMYSFNYVIPLAVSNIWVLPIIWFVPWLGYNNNISMDIVIVANIIAQASGLIIGIYFSRNKVIKSNEVII